MCFKQILTQIMYPKLPDKCLMTAWQQHYIKWPLNHSEVDFSHIWWLQQQDNNKLLAYEAAVSCAQPKTCSYFWPKICITNHSALELAFFMRSKPAHWGKVSCDKHHWPSPHICGLIYTTSPYPSSSVRLIYTTISRGCTSWDTISFGRKKTSSSFHRWFGS